MAPITAELGRIKLGSNEYPVRFSYLRIHQPQAMSEGDTPKYSMSIIIDKEDTGSIERYKKALEHVKKTQASKWGGKIPKSLKVPLRDGDEERDDENYEGCYFINASSQRKPGVVDAERQPIIDEDEVYSGAYGRVSVTLFAFNHPSGGKGISAGLNNLQKLKDGERLASGISAEDDFDDGDDMLN